MPRSNWARVPQLLSLRSRAREPLLKPERLEPVLRNGRGHHSEKPAHLRIRLPMQGTRVQSLVQEDPTCRGATGPVCHNY